MVAAACKARKPGARGAGAPVLRYNRGMSAACEHITNTPAACPAHGVAHAAITKKTTG